MTEDTAGTRAIIDAAMAVQLARLRDAVAAGVPRVGWKVAFNDAAGQQRLGLDGPVVGVLDGARVVTGDVYRPRPGSQPRVEVEIALRIGARLAGDVTREAAAAAIVAVAPAFELIDMTKPAPRPGNVGPMLEQSILHDAVAFGAEQGFAKAAEMQRWGLPRLLRNGEVLREGQAGRVPDDLVSVAVSAAKVLGRYGAALEPGDRIICGSYIEPAEIAPRDRLTADLGPVGQLEVTVGDPA